MFVLELDKANFEAYKCCKSAGFMEDETHVQCDVIQMSKRDVELDGTRSNHLPPAPCIRAATADDIGALHGLLQSADMMSMFEDRTEQMVAVRITVTFPCALMHSLACAWYCLCPGN